MIRTRIAPSPTGEDLHIGNLYTAYINFVFAKKNNGKFIVRIEDTDRTRYVQGAEKKILASLKSYGIIPDESMEIGGDYGPYRQSERLDIYKKFAKNLIDSGKAYFCICTKDRLDKVRLEMKSQKKIPKYDKFCLSNQEEVVKKIEDGMEHVVRLNIEQDCEVSFQDMIRGQVNINSSNLDDQVLIKSDGYPTYHMAVVIDDHLMNISHVIRAEEWISSTPKHILLYKAFGWDIPKYAHVPILRNPDKSKLSKRKSQMSDSGTKVWVSWYLEQGFLPEAVLNYLALMGWSHPEGIEIFDLEEFIENFSLERVHPSGPVFDIHKLEWMNGQYIMNLENQELKVKIKNFYNDKNLDEETIDKSVPLVRERIRTLKEYWDIAGFLFEIPTQFEIDLSLHKELLEKIHKTLESVSNWKADAIGSAMQDLALKENIPFGKFFMLLRIAISGKKITPPLNDSMEILGKKDCCNRIKLITNNKKL